MNYLLQCIEIFYRETVFICKYYTSCIDNFRLMWYNVPHAKGTSPSRLRHKTLTLAVARSSRAVPANKKRTFVYRQRCVFWMMFAFGKWCWLRRVMTASPNDVCLTAHWGKHHIIAEQSGATSFWAKRKSSYRRRRCIIKDTRLTTWFDFKTVL